MNGHKNWNHWNVALWIANDEGLYREARMRTRHLTLDEAAENLALDLDEAGITHTPDGAPYSKTAIRAALRDL